MKYETPGGGATRWCRYTRPENRSHQTKRFRIRNHEKCQTRNDGSDQFLLLFQPTTATATVFENTHVYIININIFILGKNREIEKRIIAESGRIFLNSIELYKVQETSREKQLTKLKQLILPIKISSNNISIAIANPQTIYILDLPLYIYTMKKYGLNTSRHLIYLYKLICQPLLIVAMILLSAAIMLRSSERKIQIGIISYSLVIGFSLYFIGDIIFALGTNDRLPALLSGFGPTLIGLFSGCYLISDMDSSKKLIMKTIG